MSSSITLMFVCVAAIGFLLAFATAAPTYSGSVVQDSAGKLVFVNGTVDPNAIAWSTFVDSMNETGWSVLRVNTNSAYSDLLQMRAAGFIEGALTAPHILQNSIISNADAYGANPAPANIVKWFATQQTWIEQQIAAHPNDRIWIGMSYIMAQLDGIQRGYEATVTGQKNPLTMTDWATMNGDGDIGDIMASLNDALRPHVDEWTAEELRKYILDNSHCSALVKVNGNLTSLWAGHATWSAPKQHSHTDAVHSHNCFTDTSCIDYFVSRTSFSDMLRIYKHYYFNLTSPLVASRGMSFSSYPGYLESIDDVSKTHKI